VSAFLARLRHVTVDVVVVGRRDATRSAALDRAVRAADAAGRRELLDDAWRRTRQMVMNAFAQRGFTGTWALTEWSVSVASARDRIAVVEAFEEAAAAAVTADLVDDETKELLEATAGSLEGMSHLPRAGALSEMTPATVRRHGVAGTVVAVAFGALLLGSGIAAAAPVVLVAGMLLVAIGIVAQARRAAQRG
jgi:hypothetical protein